MVARYCPSYSDVFANRARNNIMESLNDLGPDSPYTNFTQVEPSIEDGLAPQTNCHPLTGWTFAFGTGIGSNAAGTNLSYVTGTGTVADRQVTTQASVPLLNGTGQPTGQQIAGATTFTLTPTEVDLAARGSSYWVMGGTPSAPLNNQGAQYGFAALRCATDNLNGDNVEYVSYPTNTTHVFCYAFYVQPPPHSATVTIQKQLSATQPSDETFDFNGSLSYNPGGAFSLTVPHGTTTAGTDFIRGESLAGDAPWTATEDIPDGYQLTGLLCTSTGGSSFTYTGSNSGSTVPGGHDGVAITLTAGDHVTCTFTDTLEPSQGELTTHVVMADGSAVPPGVLPDTFDYTVVNPSSSSSTVSNVVEAATQSGGTGVVTLTPGTWSITPQALPTHPGWSYSWVSTICDVNGTSTSYPAGEVTVTVPPGGDGSCAFTNELTPTGSLTVRFTTLGGTGTFGATISSSSGTTLNQSATTTSEGTAVAATGDSTDPLLGAWSINPSIPPITAAGRWVLASTPSCDAGTATNVGDDQLDVNVGTTSTPDVTCDYAYRLLPPSTLALTKLITGDLGFWTAPVVLSVTCSDGTTASLEVDPGQGTPASLTPQLSFPLPVSCAVAETSNGTGPTGAVTTTSAVSVDGAPSTMAISALSVGTDATSQAVAVSVTNNYSQTLAFTGTSPFLLGAGAVGVVALGSGAALFVFARRRTRRAQR
jgi:hypothetical protein